MLCICHYISTCFKQGDRRNIVGRSRLLRVLGKHRFQPYKIRKVHNLHIEDAERRINFCHWYVQKRTANFFQDIIWTDEAYISYDVIFEHWSGSNPNQTFDRIQQGTFGFYVWVALCNGAVLRYSVFPGNLNANEYIKSTRGKYYRNVICLDKKE